MRNIPSNDPGLIMVPGATSFCEWLVRMNGGIATCVEASEMIVDHLVKTGFPVSAAEDRDLAQDLINRGQAGPSGATNYLAASEQMRRLGIPNTAYGADWFNAHDFVPVVRLALSHGIPVLFGLSAAYRLHDNWTNSGEDAGVYGHGITLVGVDNTGAIVADPNTQQALDGDFVHYTWANLRAAGGNWPSMVIPSKGATQLGVPAGWTDVNGVLTAPNNIQVVRGFAEHIRNTNWAADNYPLEAERWMTSLELQNSSLGPGSQQIFRRTMLDWDEKRGVVEAWVGGELLATRGALATANTATAAAQKALADATQAANAAQAALQQQIATLQAQVASLQDQISNPAQPGPTTPAGPAVPTGTATPGGPSAPSVPTGPALPSATSESPDASPTAPVTGDPPQPAVSAAAPSATVGPAPAAPPSPIPPAGASAATMPVAPTLEPAVAPVPAGLAGSASPEFATSAAAVAPAGAATAPEARRVRWALFRRAR